jgi:DNA replication protein DnaC
VHRDSGQFNPSDNEIAAETVWYLMRHAGIPTRESLDHVLSNGIMAEKCQNREVFYEKFEAQKPTQVPIDYGRIRKSEFWESIAEQFREQYEKEFHLRGQGVMDEEKIKELDHIIKEKMDRIAMLPSVIDAGEFKEPAKPPEEFDIDEGKEWWQRLYLTDDPFKEKQGLYDIEPDRYDSVLVKMPLFTQYTHYMDELPQELFKNAIFFGQNGSGKTALLQYLQRAASLHQIDSAFVSLSALKDFQAFKTAFEEKLAEELRDILEEPDRNLSIKELIRRLGHKPNFKGILVFIDDMNKLDEDTPSVLTFLKYLQVPKAELAKEISGKLGFYVAGSLAWKDTILSGPSSPSYSASLIHRETLPPIKVEQAMEMLDKRLESYYPNPTIKRTVKREFIEQVYKDLVIHGEELTFRKFMERFEMKVKSGEGGDFTALTSDPVHIQEETLTRIKAIFQSDPVLKERFRALLEDWIKVNQKNGVVCIRILRDIFRKQRTTGARDEDFPDKDHQFYLNALEKTGLISRVDEKRVEGGIRQHSWGVCKELEDINEKIAEKFQLSLEDYLLKIYGEPEVKRRRLNEEVEQVRVFSEGCNEAQARELMNKVLTLHTKIIEDYYVDKATPRQRFQECIESLNTLTQFFVKYVERPENYSEEQETLYFWRDFWYFPNDISDFLNWLSDEETCVRKIWNTVGLYSQAFKTIFQFTKKEYKALSSVHIGSYGLDKEDAETLVRARDLWTDQRNEACVATLENHITKKARTFVQNIMNLIYGDLPNRIKHMDSQSRERIQAAISAGEIRHGARSRETDFLSFKNLVMLITSAQGKEASGCWQHVFSKFFGSITAVDMMKYGDGLEGMKAHYDRGDKPTEDETLVLREMISTTVDLTRKMNAGYSLLLKSLRLESEGSGTALYLSLDELSDKEETSGMIFHPNSAKTLVDGLSSGRIGLDNPDFIQDYFSLSMSYREFYFYLALILDSKKANTLGLVVPYSLDKIRGSAIYVKKTFSFNKENPPRIFLAYSGKDVLFVDRLASDLRGNNVNVWTDDIDLKEGNPINPGNHPPPKEGDHLGIVLSQNSINSEWVRNDLTISLFKMLEEKRILVQPIMYKKCGVPTAIVSRRVVDFTGGYPKGLEGLLSVLEEFAPKAIEYNERIDIVGQKAGDLLNQTLSLKISPNWMSELLDKNVVYKANDRLRDKVPEDPRTHAYQFLTLGELKVALKVEKIWSTMRETFVNVKGSSTSLKFNTDELFFGNFDLLIAYRNPPSHGIEVTIAKVNMQMIEASLSKLEGILGIGPTSLS